MTENNPNSKLYDFLDSIQKHLPAGSAALSDMNLNDKEISVQVLSRMPSAQWALIGITDRKAYEAFFERGHKEGFVKILSAMLVENLIAPEAINPDDQFNIVEFVKAEAQEFVQDEPKPDAEFLVKSCEGVEDLKVARRDIKCIPEVSIDDVSLFLDHIKKHPDGNQTKWNYLTHRYLKFIAADTGVKINQIICVMTHDDYYSALASVRASTDTMTELSANGSRGLQLFYLLQPDTRAIICDTAVSLLKRTAEADLSAIKEQMLAY